MNDLSDAAGISLFARRALVPPDTRVLDSGNQAHLRDREGPIERAASLLGTTPEELAESFVPPFEPYFPALEGHRSAVEFRFWSVPYGGASLLLRVWLGAGGSGASAHVYVSAQGEAEGPISGCDACVDPKPWGSFRACDFEADREHFQRAVALGQEFADRRPGVDALPSMHSPDMIFVEVAYPTWTYMEGYVVPPEEFPVSDHMAGMHQLLEDVRERACALEHPLEPEVGR